MLLPGGDKKLTFKGKCEWYQVFPQPVTLGMIGYVLSNVNLYPNLKPEPYFEFLLW